MKVPWATPIVIDVAARPDSSSIPTHPDAMSTVLGGEGQDVAVVVRGAGNRSVALQARWVSFESDRPGDVPSYAIVKLPPVDLADIEAAARPMLEIGSNDGHVEDVSSFVARISEGRGPGCDELVDLSMPLQRTGVGTIELLIRYEWASMSAVLTLYVSWSDGG